MLPLLGQVHCLHSQRCQGVAVSRLRTESGFKGHSKQWVSIPAS
jgi:hypothetical protein